MTEQPEKLDLRSHDVAEDKRQQLLHLFPEIRIEGGKLDFDRLKLALGEGIEVGKERFGMNWPGKSDCFKAIQSPSLGTLLPCPEKSVNFDSSENLIIEGDNLEVLKLLQKSYLGKVKMIYIDPPYNTGNDFIYPDNYAETLQTYLEFTGQVDSEGKKFSTNTEAVGRFHSKWLNMMYPRLYLARNLMRDDGIIFITVDDTEAANCRMLLNEIFGEENFLASIAWEKRYTRSNNARLFYSLKDWILAYRKSDAVSFLREARSEKSKELYSNPDDDTRGPWTSSSYVNPATKDERKNLVYGIKNPFSGEVIEHPTHAWKYEPSEHKRHVEEKRLWWGQKGDAKFPRLKNFLSEVGEGMVPTDVWDYKSSGTTDEGGLEVKELFGEAVFDNPKPSRLVRRMLGLCTNGQSTDLVLDFFAGSGTTGHAVLDQNSEDGGARRFILVQLPEPTDRKDFGTISAITEERVRRVIARLKDKDKEKLDFDDKQKSDLGFRVFKLAESNFKPWNAEVTHNAPTLERQLELHVSHIREERKDREILYEILLKSGYSLTTPIETVALAGKTVYGVAGGQLLICLERKLTLELIRAMAERKPERVVCLDEGFAGNDQLKTNAAHIFEPTDRREAKSDAKRFRTV
jgi:adenine-specific DNA-methyltransferase